MMRPINSSERLAADDARRVQGLLLNSIGGVVFGWLYWRRGLEHAVVAHYCADIILQGVGGS